MLLHALSVLQVLPSMSSVTVGSFGPRGGRRGISFPSAVGAIAATIAGARPFRLVWTGPEAAVR